MNIKIENINYKYNEFEDKNVFNLKNISFDIEDNDYVAIIGETGSGKSTLVQHLNGLIKATSGAIYIDGKNIYDDKYDLNKLRQKVGLVFQYPEYQFFAETVIEDVAFGAKNMGYSNEEAIQMAKTTLNMVGIKDELFDKLPFMLSGGEKRKVAIAGVLVMDPEVVIMDEPQAGLDPISKYELFEMIDKLYKKGKTIIIVTHNMEDVIEYSKKVVIMRHGELLAVDSPVNIFNNDKLLLEAHILKPEQVILSQKLNKKYKKYNLDKIKTKDIIDEILRVVNNK